MKECTMIFKQRELKIKLKFREENSIWRNLILLWEFLLRVVPQNWLQLMLSNWITRLISSGNLILYNGIIIGRIVTLNLRIFFNFTTPLKNISKKTKKKKCGRCRRKKKKKRNQFQTSHYEATKTFALPKAHLLFQCLQKSIN